MTDYRIAVVPGDGIGKEVIPAALQVLRVAEKLMRTFRLRTQLFPWGCDYYLKHNRMMPEDGLERLRKFDAILLGAIGFPSVPDHISLWGLLLPLRRRFDQYVNVRPIRLLRGVATPLRNIKPGDIDIVFVRENTEGEYSGAGGRVHVGTPNEVAVQTAIFTRPAIERVVRYAFGLARVRRNRLTSVTKSNAIQHTMVFWDEVVAEISREYPMVSVEKLHMDIAAAALVTRPRDFDVVVGSNLFVDVLSDLGPAIAGGLGIAPSANLNPEGAYPSMFEPVHGSAPDIAGKGVANPIGAVWSAALMMERLGEKEAADRICTAIEVTLEAGVKTRDLGGNASTAQFTKALLARL